MSRDAASAPRYVATTGLVLALYFAAEWVVPAFRARPWLLLAAVLAAPVVGVFIAAWQERTRSAQPRGRSKHVATTIAALGMIGLVGLSLILARALTAESAQWMFLGMGSLAAGAAGHAWFRDRQATT